jgi:hypothetical protein
MINLDSFVCVGNLTTYPSLTSLWESVVCPYKEFLEWNARECLFGECEMCGVENLLVYPIEEEALLNNPISWKFFSLGKIVIKKEKRKKNYNLCRSLHLLLSSLNI